MCQFLNYSKCWLRLSDTATPEFNVCEIDWATFVFAKVA